MPTQKELESLCALLADPRCEEYMRAFDAAFLPVKYSDAEHYFENEKRERARLGLDEACKRVVEDRHADGHPS